MRFPCVIMVSGDDDVHICPRPAGHMRVADNMVVCGRITVMLIERCMQREQMSRLDHTWDILLAPGSMRPALMRSRRMRDNQSGNLVECGRITKACKTVQLQLAPK